MWDRKENLTVLGVHREARGCMRGGLVTADRFSVRPGEGALRGGRGVRQGWTGKEGGC